MQIPLKQDQLDFGSGFRAAKTSFPYADARAPLPSTLSSTQHYHPHKICFCWEIHITAHLFTIGLALGAGCIAVGTRAFSAKYLETGVSKPFFDRHRLFILVPRNRLSSHQSGFGQGLAGVRPPFHRKLFHTTPQYIHGVMR